MTVRTLVMSGFLVPIAGCGFTSCRAISIEKLEADVKEIVEFEAPRGCHMEILSTGPGEGDFDHVYVYIAFRLMSDSRESEPCVIARNDPSVMPPVGDLIILYQRSRSGLWESRRYGFRRSDGREVWRSHSRERLPEESDVGA